MHDYAILGHDRANIGRWLGFIAIILAGLITQLMTSLFLKTGTELFEVTVTVGMTYVGLHYVFNKWAWKIPFFPFPDVSGIWIVEGKTINSEGKVTYNWNATIDIGQTWKEISITLKTKSSESHSYTATLTKKPGTKESWLLSYSYKNEPQASQIHELNAHRGYCEIEFNGELDSGVANYFNNGGRRTFGEMAIRRKKDD